MKATVSHEKDYGNIVKCEGPTVIYEGEDSRTSEKPIYVEHQQ